MVKENRIMVTLWSVLTKMGHEGDFLGAGNILYVNLDVTWIHTHAKKH